MRISRESHAPTSTAASERKKYARPMILWSVLKTWRRRKDLSVDAGLRLGEVIMVQWLAAAASCACFHFAKSSSLKTRTVARMR
jgi:hypothetical protein